MTLDLIAQENGFNDSREMSRLIATVDISTPEKFAAFKKWQYTDGTKDGLMKLFDTSVDRALSAGVKEMIG